MNVNVIRDGIRRINKYYLVPTNKQETINGSSYTRLSELHDWRKMLKILEEWDFANQDIDALKQYEAYKGFGDSALESYSAAQEIIRLSTIIQFKFEAIENLLDNNLAYDEPGTLRIKLPESSGFQDLEKTFSDLKIAISIPIRNTSISGEIKVLRGEPGSIWIVVLVIGAATMSLIADLVWSARVVEQEKSNDETMNALASRYQDNEALKTMLREKQEKHISDIIDKEVSGIINRNNMEADGEEFSQLQVAIKKLVELHGKGALVIPSGSNSDDVIKLFPPEDQTRQLESKVLQLRDHNEQAS